ncbi:MAG: hypothetical protein JST19_19560 [Bacteroidetes bacterium]|nr:hypothetical protein [Bacteroidota bacterium]
MKLFRGRKLVIATKHKKEAVIAPALEAALGVTCLVDPGLDTDKFGTFTGEIERDDDPITTARKKCLAAMDRTGCELAVASEGSFGPHPTLLFVPADDEIVLLVDQANTLEIFGREVSLNTNFNGQTVQTCGELLAFARKATFPSHGLIIRDEKDSNKFIRKGIISEKELINAFETTIASFGSGFVETDMRALYNPTRMEIIRQATNRLLDKINSICPQCSAPGFGLTDIKPGLPCASCGLPTRSALYHILRCIRCSYTEEDKFPLRLTVENPMYCDYCNP